jgi:hypothetical protein
VFKNKWFSRFAKKEDITDANLMELVSDLEKGIACANLGGNVYKKRIARSGEGKAGGYRTIVYYKSGFRSFFVYGYAKSNRDNIADDELVRFNKDAATSLGLTEEQLKARLKNGTLIEII